MSFSISASICITIALVAVISVPMGISAATLMKAGSFSGKKITFTSLAKKKPMVKMSRKKVPRKKNTGL